MRIVAVIQARMASSRLPGKVLRPLAGRPILARVIAAAGAAPQISQTVVATGDDESNAPIRDWCAEQGTPCFVGSEPDVLDRVTKAAEAYEADAVLRLTADCPLIDPAVIAQVASLFRRSGVDYASNVAPPQWPDGLDCEIISIAALRAAAREAVQPSDREHVTPFVRNNRARFPSATLDCPLPGLAGLRWTVDTEEDMAHAENLVAVLTALGRPAEGPFGWGDLLYAEESLASENAVPRQSRNQGYSAATEAELGGGANNPPRRFVRSAEALARAERTIPLGAQTFSKSRTQFPVGEAPLFLTAGEGARVWDVDGNEFVDLINGLLCVSLGYCDPQVDAAVRAQLDRGVSFSLSTELEAELAERIVSIVPCAESVRFGKNGSDATTAAVRVARAHTGRERVAICGYHGWHDWYIATTSRSGGVPAAVRGLSHKVPYNDLDAVDALLSAYPGEFACIVMEPANAAAPNPNYLQDLKALAHGHGALLVFDEVITGFRFALGGAQALFGVTPDLASFGKGMANGLPISALAGRADVMAKFEDIFVSGTFGGEALSLAAAIATIDKMRREPVIETLWRTGSELAVAVEGLIERNGLSEVLSLAGFDPWRLLSVKPHESADEHAIKTFYITEMAQRGVLTLGSHNISYAHDARDLRHVVSAYADVLALMAEKLESAQLEQELRAPKLVPIFQVR
ncbi:MAG: aminotransferase class III-fold pyridoxal phosphate-dependent enzyme [Marivibrio sp.]|uniref:aminotransferase class III-fold pyridoxal phosphate-dependent enzyme n=1 Tax=Marivibrio sp. TaxID=2039719 RepID=UPI0032EDE28A